MDRIGIGLELDWNWIEIGLEMKLEIYGSCQIWIG